MQVPGDRCARSGIGAALAQLPGLVHVPGSLDDSRRAAVCDHGALLLAVVFHLRREDESLLRLVDEAKLGLLAWRADPSPHRSATLLAMVDGLVHRLDLASQPDLASRPDGHHPAEHHPAGPTGAIAAVLPRFPTPLATRVLGVVLTDALPPERAAILGALPPRVRHRWHLVGHLGYQRYARRLGLPQPQAPGEFSPSRGEEAQWSATRRVVPRRRAAAEGAVGQSRRPEPRRPRPGGLGERVLPVADAGPLTPVAAAA